MRYIVKRVEKLEDTTTTEYLNENGFFDKANPIRFFDSSEDASKYIDLETSDSKYDKSYMGACTFEVVPVGNLRAYREASGLSQNKLAESAGVSPRMIQHYEQGVKDINKAQGVTLYKIAQALNCKIENLLELNK